MATRITTVEMVYSDAELAEKAKEMARLRQHVGQLEEELRAVAADFKGRIKTLCAEAAAIEHDVNLGFERKDVEADLLLNTPTHGQKTYIDIATGAVLKVEDMVDADGQSRLFDDDLRPDPMAEQPSEEPAKEAASGEASEPTDADVAAMIDGLAALGINESEILGLDPDLDRSHENRPRGRGRPPGSKNKPKSDVVPGFAEGAPGPDELPGEEGMDAHA